MKYRDALIAWNPGTDQIRVGSLLRDGTTDWTRHPIRYRFTGGAAYMHVRDAAPPALELMLFIEFNTIVVRDRIPVDAAHKAFLAIDEYRKCISPDTAGADPD